MNRESPPLTREQLDVIRERVERGANPLGLSHWLARTNDLGEENRAQVQAAGEDFQSGNGQRWYAMVPDDGPRRAADTPTDPPTVTRLPSQHHDRD